VSGTHRPLLGLFRLLVTLAVIGDITEIDLVHSDQGDLVPFSVFVTTRLIQRYVDLCLGRCAAGQSSWGIEARADVALVTISLQSDIKLTLGQRRHVQEQP
jgi:hypothetical protein